MGKRFKPVKKEFYRFWTVHEAEIKLNGHIRSLFSETLEQDYMLPVFPIIFLFQISASKINMFRQEPKPFRRI